MFTRFAASAFAAASIIGTASAADLPRKTVAPVFAAAPVASWTGFYVGVNAGAQLSDNEWRTTDIPFFGPGGIPAANTPLTRGFDKTAFRLGAYAGYNWQLNQSWVVGAEVDIGFNIGGKKTTVGLPGTFGAAFAGLSSDRLSVSNTYDGSLRLRAGYLIAPSFLIYATGGLALQHYDLKATCSGDINSWCFVAQVQSDSKTRVGWTLGAGLEGLITNNLIGRVEYRYADYGSSSHSLFPATPFDTVNGRVTVRTHTIQAGIAYKF
jgi:outer membrane immunogenic protein